MASRWARWSIGVLAAGALSLLAFFGTGHETLDPRRVVIARMSNETGEGRLSYLGPLATDRLTEALAQTRGLRVATSATIIPSQVNPGLQVDTLDDPARLRALAQETAAGTLISGSYFRADGRVSFQAEITDANSGTIVSAIGPIEAPAANAEPAVDSLSRRVADELRRHLHAGSR